MSSGLTSLIEATALGKPSVITRNKYLPMQFEENNVGLFVDSMDIGSLRKAILKIYSDEELRNKLGENAKKFATDKCNLETFTKELTLLFSSI